MTKEEYMSRHRRPISTRPFLFTLGGLLALSVTTPRLWDALVRQDVRPTFAHAQSLGQPTLAPPKKKRQVVAGAQDDLALAVPAVRYDLPLIGLPKLDRPDTVGLMPVIATPQERVARQTYIPRPDGGRLVPKVIEESTSAARALVSRLPAITSPVKQLVGRFAEVASTDPYTLIDDGNNGHLQRAAELVASRPVRSEPVVPETTGLAMPRTQLQPEVRQVPAVIEEIPAWWPKPVELLTHLEKLRWTPDAGAWAMDVRVLLLDLAEEPGPTTPRALEIVNELNDLVSELNLLLPNVSDPAASASLRRAGYSLSRRMDMWTWISDMVDPSAEATVKADPARLHACLAEIVAITDQHPKGAEWRDYLLVDALSELTREQSAIRAEQEQALVQRVLTRLERGGINAWAQQYSSPLALSRLRGELRHWTSDDGVDPRELLSRIEQFEQTSLPSHGKLVAMQYRELMRSPGEAEQQLARQIETHYRNANVRITFTDEMVNRMLPPQKVRNAPVNDQMMGFPTKGWSRTQTDVHVRFIPDPTRIRMALEARGKIFSQTYTVSGPVTVHSDTDSSFVAAKEMRLDLDGFATDETEVEAEARPILRRIQSKLDVPLVRSLIQSVARNQYDESQPQARVEAKRKITHEVRTQMDAEMSTHFREGNAAFKSRFIEPMTELGLSPQMIESETTRDRCTMRLRLAADDQLAGHGPRPRAPSDSLMSMQLHESVINNLFAQLDWDGKTFTLMQLRDQVAAKLRAEIVIPDEENLQDLYITFASENSIRMHCRDGRAELNLSFAKLRKGQQTWRDFTVRVYYRPNLDEPGSPLHRDGTVQLIGSRLNTGAQIALRGIFSKAFPPSKTFKLIPDKMVARKPGLADMVVTQCELRDGWIGIAMAARTPLPTPSTPIEPITTGPLRIFRK